LKVEFKQIIPQLVVPDVITAAEYYRDALGFELLGYFSDPPVYAMVRRGAAEIHFGKSDLNEILTNRTLRKGLGSDIYIFVSEINELHRELTSAGAEIVEGPIEREYNCTEIVVRDCFGYHIVFAA
jgi:uncharacterized glyoxalase superfamily protein PhnB